MKPFLLIQSREDVASDDEHRSFTKFSGLNPEQLIRCRIETGVIPDVRLDDYSGVILGGGPWNVSNPKKSPPQIAGEQFLTKLLDEIVARDFPFLGACLGVGLLTNHLGGSVGSKHSEPVSGVSISLSDKAKDDPVTAGLSQNFIGIVGHKEAADHLPDGATLLASSSTCPVQMFRVKKNIYATQFHPELDSDALILRIKVYKNAGYFEPTETDDLIKMAKEIDASESTKVLRNFVKLANSLSS